MLFSTPIMISTFSTSCHMNEVLTTRFTGWAWINLIKTLTTPCSVRAGRKKNNNHINHCGILLKWRAVAFPQPRTSIAASFQWGRKIKVQIQLLFGVADLWVFCLIYVTLIEVPKGTAAGSCTKGNHRMFTQLRREAAIKSKRAFHLGGKEKVLSGQELC